MDESMKPLRRKEDEFMREPWGRGTFCALCFGAAYDRISMGSNRKKKKKLEKGGKCPSREPPEDGGKGGSFPRGKNGSAAGQPTE